MSAGDRVCRAKFKCTTKTERHWTAGQVKYDFSAVTADEVPENARYHKYSPSGTFEITVDNPNVTFELGKSYYLDVVEAAE